MRRSDIQAYDGFRTELLLNQKSMNVKMNVKIVLISNLTCVNQ